jgi:hypothetical protein
MRADGIYPIRVAPDRRHVVDQAGAPYLIFGDTPWSLISGLTKEEAERYLENRRRKGFNSIIVNLIEHKFRGPVNRYAQGPFTRPGDFSTPNEKYFAHADWVIRKAGEKGIQVFLAPIYLGYIGTDEGWIEETRANSSANCLNWGRYVGRRYRDFDNLVWLIGGDRNPDEVLPKVNAIVAGIREFDQRHLFTAHCHPENSGPDHYKEGWLDLNGTYTYQVVHRKLLLDYRRTPAMPFFLMETTYEGEHNASPVQIRRQAYWALLCGAAGQFLGNRPIWLFDQGWEAALDSTGSEDMARAYALFRSRPWHELVPDEEFREKRRVVVDGCGEYYGMDYVAAARTADGGTVMAYLPDPHSITVDLTRVAGKSAMAWWFDPRRGKSAAAGQFATAGKHRFTPPGDGDWVLVLDDASRALPPPGKP